MAIAGANAGLLRKLSNRSLLEQESSTRYRFHDLAAEYARAQLDTATTLEVRTAHARYFSTVAILAEERYLRGDVSGGLLLFDCERANVEAAYCWLSCLLDDADSARIMISFVNNLSYISDLRIHPREQLSWFEKLAPCCSSSQ